MCAAGTAGHAGGVGGRPSGAPRGARHVRRIPSHRDGGRIMTRPLISPTTRRGFLRGAGSLCLGLPWLESLAQAGGGGLGDPPPRFLVLVTKNGTWPERHWPTGSEYNFTLNTIMSDLEPYKDRMVVLKGVDNQAAMDTGGQRSHRCDPVHADRTPRHEHERRDRGRRNLAGSVRGRRDRDRDHVQVAGGPDRRVVGDVPHLDELLWRWPARAFRKQPPAAVGSRLHRRRPGQRS